MHKIILLIDISEEYGQNLMKGVVKYSKEHGPWIFCRMPLFYRETLGMDGILNFAREWEADGIIAQLYNDLDVKRVLDAGISLIVEDFKERFSDIPNITGGYFEAGKMGAEYFLGKGFKNFAFYGFKNIVWSRERSEGFENHLNTQGYEVHHFDQDLAPSRELWYYKPSALSQWLQSLPKPIAIMACDDERGQHITEACKHARIQIPEEIAVLGVENWGAAMRFPKYGDLAKAHAGTENFPVKLLLSHDPSHWDAQVRKQYPDIDLTFSGHTHGMQFGIEIPGFRWSPSKYIYKQWADLYQEGEQFLYVNRGLGFLGYPGRVGILPEITVVELHNA